MKIRLSLPKPIGGVNGIYTLVLCLVSQYSVAFETRLEDEYQVVKSFIKSDSCQSLCDAADETINRFYTKENLKDHIAYLADRQGNLSSLQGRDAHAFVIHHSSGDSDNRLPGIAFRDLDERLQHMCQKAEKELGINKGRYLLNFQRYYQDSVYLPLHYDGELYSFIKHEDDSITITEAIIPNKTAVLTLINYAVGGGTKISKKDKSDSTVVQYNSGDLLIFNNSKILHGAEAFKANDNFTPPYVRYTMGWRSLEQDCKYLNLTENDEMKDVTYEEAVQKNVKFMENDWP